MIGNIVLFPEPQQVKQTGEAVPLGSAGRVSIAAPTSDDPILRSALDRLAAAIEELGGQARFEAEADIILAITAAGAEAAAKNAEQAYTLVAADGTARLSASTPQGLLYGAVTLGKLLRREGDKFLLPGCEIGDWPDLKYRGLFAESRWGPDLMTLQDWKAAIDYLVDLKLNVLTIGIYNCWPIQYNDEVSEFLLVPLEKHPELVKKQRIEYYSRERGEWQSLEYVARMVEDDFFGDVVAYGQTKGVMVRPHFNTPGHNTLIPRLIPEISALDENGDPTGYGFCLSNEKTYEVMFDIIDDICDKYLLPNGVRSYHIAGDEVYPLVGMHPDHPYRRIDPWCKCEQCRQRSDQHNYVEYIVRIATHLKEKGIEHISMWHDQLVRGGAMSEVLTRRFAQAGLTDNIILHWWRYSDFFDTTMPELGFRRWVTPMTGYFYQMAYRGHIDNIFLAAKLGVAEGAEGTESYGLFDKSFHRHFCALSEWSWNNAGGGEPEEFHLKYARAVCGDDWRQGLRGLRYFSGIVDNPAATALSGSLFRYAYDYGQTHEQALARDNYPQLQIGALWDAPPGISTGIIGALRGEAQRARRELDKAQWLDEELKHIYLIECDRIAVMAGGFVTALEIVDAYNSLRSSISADEALRCGEIMAASSDRLVANLDEMDELIASIEAHREPYQQPHMLRELALMRRFLASLLGSINVIHEAISAHKITSLPALELMKITHIPWEG